MVKVGIDDGYGYVVDSKEVKVEFVKVFVEVDEGVV